MNANRICSFRILTFVAALIGAFHCAAQTPEWIWYSQNPTNDEVRYFRKTFKLDGKASKATLAIAADDTADVFINEKLAVSARGFKTATRTDITALLQPGENLVSVRAVNDTGPAGFLAQIEIARSGGKKQIVVSGDSWITSAVAEDWRSPDMKPSPNWITASSLGKVGVKPWGDSLKTAEATAATSLTILPDFKVQLLRSAQPSEGSWICMTVDPKGRLIISPQRDDQPLLRFTLSSRGQVKKVESIPAPLHQAMGVCYAHDSLYVNGHGPDGTGLYRLIDANHNDQFETNEVHFLKKFEGEGEHGYHAVECGPDGMIYVMNGNHTKLPAGIAADSPHRNYQEDQLLPRQWDANGHAVGILAPGGHILRTDAEGKNWELLLAGFRNSYDFDFNAAGEIFTFDSDMEWDWGLPWYRPTRIIHSVTGGEYGWRSGSGKWPDYYEDSLPATVDIGIGSPTGVKFGTKSNYPEKYRRAFYAMDWSYGRILAVHLTPSGASYTGNFETFLKGKPLNVADLEFGKDGAMYFITGGRATQSGLYRVSYTGKSTKRKNSDTDSPTEKAAAQARELRHKLESFHGKTNSEAVAFAWPHLNSPDRFIRYAARIAIESQPVATWQDRVLSETEPQAGLTALLALARCGGRDIQNDLLHALKNFPSEVLTLDQKMEKLRIIELSFIRQGRPEPEVAKLVAERLDAIYPTRSERFNRELAQLLVYLNDPNVITKTLDLLDHAPTQEEQDGYIFYLRNVKSGWTLEQRKKYFDWFVQAKQIDTNSVTINARHPAQLLQWFKDVDRDYSDGASYSKFLVNFRKDALTTLSATERTNLGALVQENLDVAAWKPTKERAFVKDWQMSDLESQLDQVAAKRNYESGKAAFNDAQCIQCHRFVYEGGTVGPELTAASSKYTRRDILESIVDPSKVVSDQYQNETITKTDGEDVSGRVTDEDANRIVIAPSMLAPETQIEVKKTDIARRVPSKVSPMPSGLVNNLTQDEILDLLAYIESMGKSKAPNFKK